MFVDPPVYVSIGTGPCSNPLEARAVAFRVLKLPLSERTEVIDQGTPIHLLGAGVAHRVEEVWREVEGVWDEEDHKKWIVFRLSENPV